MDSTLLEIKPSVSEENNVKISLQTSLDGNHPTHKEKEPSVCKDRSEICVDFKMKDEQNNQKLYTCPFCSNVFSGKSNLKIHLCIHSKEQSCVCVICGKVLAGKSSLWSHFRTHTKEKPFTCEVCNKQFVTKFVMKKHLLIHTREKCDTFTSETCGKNYADSSTLKRHLQLHKNESISIREDSNVEFPSESSLDGSHQSLEEKERNIQVCPKFYTCPLCYEIFPDECNLKIHSCTTRKKKAHFCVVCGEGFSTKTHLEHHFLSHTSEKPFGCGICNKRFASKSSLKYHIYVHIGEKL